VLVVIPMAAQRRVVQGLFFTNFRPTISLLRFLPLLLLLRQFLPLLRLRLRLLLLRGIWRVPVGALLQLLAVVAREGAGHVHTLPLVVAVLVAAVRSA
jgi:hypothetical protein